MPSDIGEAFTSPFNNSLPTSKLYDSSTFTKESIINEFNHEKRSESNYHFKLPKSNRNQLPKYEPSSCYPAMHPIYDNEEDSILNDPQQGAGWIKNRDPDYLKDNTVTYTSHYDDLINQVLASKYCREKLCKLLSNQQNNVIEGFSTTFDNSLILYCVGGLLLLCIVELLIKCVQSFKI